MDVTDLAGTVGVVGSAIGAAVGIPVAVAAAMRVLRSPLTRIETAVGTLSERVGAVEETQRDIAREMSADRGGTLRDIVLSTRTELRAQASRYEDHLTYLHGGHARRTNGASLPAPRRGE